MIHLSSPAAREIGRLIATGSQPDNRTFRIGVQPGGCSDLYYTLEPSAHITADDQVWEREGLRIVVDPNSLPAIDGTTLDYAEDLMGGGFRFHNPQAIATCGCGASFSLQDSTLPDPTSCTHALGSPPVEPR